MRSKVLIQVSDAMKQKQMKVINVLFILLLLLYEMNGMLQGLNVVIPWWVV